MLRNVFRLFAILPLFALICSGCGGGSPAGSPATSVPTLFATDIDSTGAGNILSYPLTSSGSSLTATTSFRIASTTSQVFVVRGDGAGNVYVLTTSSDYKTITLLVYTAFSGVLTPVRSFTSLLTSEATAMVPDKTGIVYIAEQSGFVAKFAATASGAASPTNLYPAAGLFDAMAIDSTGNIYALQPSVSSIIVYAPGFANTTPVRTIPLSAYMNATLSDIVVDGANNLYVTGSTYPQFIGFGQTGVILEFGSGGNVPIRNITGAATLLGEPFGIAIFSNGDAYVCDLSTSSTQKTYSVFGPTANGNAAPIQRFTGSEYNVNGFTNASLAID